MEADEKQFYVLLTIFGAFLGIGPFIMFEATGTWTFLAGCVLSVLGLGGLLMLIRDRLRIKERVGVVARSAGVQTSIKIMSVLGIWILMAMLVSYLHDLRSDLNTYVMPRTITKQQAQKLREYLSKRESCAVTIKVVRHDQEAMEYAGQLFNAMRQTNWDINPPNHGGPEYVKFEPYGAKPNLSNYGQNHIEAFLRDYAEWVNAEVRRNADENNFDATGLNIQVEMPGQPVNPDPRHPTPDQLLSDALQYAGLEEPGRGGSYNKDGYKLSLLVGHRPRILGDQTPLKDRIAHWIESRGQ